MILRRNIPLIAGVSLLLVSVWLVFAAVASAPHPRFDEYDPANATRYEP